MAAEIELPTSDLIDVLQFQDSLWFPKSGTQGIEETKREVWVGKVLEDRQRLRLSRKAKPFHHAEDAVPFVNGANLRPALQGSASQ